MIQIKKALPIPYEGNFVAAAVQMGGRNQQIVQHSGIIIKYENEYKVFHFGPQIMFDQVSSNWHFVKDLVIIDSRLTGSFYNMCLKIKDHDNPGYAMLFDGSFYKPNGDFFGETTLPHYTSCVGFCLSVIKGALLGVDFIQIKDWSVNDNFGIDYMGYADDWINKIMGEHPHLDREELAKYIKRITPLEYFTASFSGKVPVEKMFTDANKTEVLKILIA